MDTGAKTMAAALDELQVLGLKTMASSLESLYNSPEFNNTGRLELISRLISDEYDARMTSRYNGRLKKARRKGCICSLDNCVDTKDRQYQPDDIVTTLARMQFIKDGMNLFILGPSDSGKSYLAKALGIVACNDYKVEYHHCEVLLEQLVALKAVDYMKYQKRLKKICGAGLLILDDFLLHTLSDEREVKILFEIMEKRCEINLSTIICSQREPASWSAMIMNDEVSSNAILKRATKHYTVMIKPRVAG